MKNNIRRMTAILKLFDPEDFYSIQVCDGVVLQGCYKTEIAKKAKELRFNVDVNSSGYVICSRGNYRIALT